LGGDVSKYKIYISLFQTSSRKIGDCWEEKSQNIKYIFLCFRQAQGKLEIVGRGSQYLPRTTRLASESTESKRFSALHV
jgi:hypothetical protein